MTHRKQIALTQAYSPDLSIDELAAAAGVERQTATRYLRNNGLPSRYVDPGPKPNTGHNAWLRRDHTPIIAHLTAAGSTAKTAAAFNISRQRVYQIVKQYEADTGTRLNRRHRHKQAAP